ncbi:MAG: nucleotidyltransferase [Acidobacteria bacterium]|nr:MAG: nucleotidyltransferase [Acidobacteriota bacterium]PYS84817.1 MAG: nucleotidyltransferase [Acidobacteriota bacterium]
MPTAAIEIPFDRLAEFCRRYQVRELSLFGSALRGDFGPDSDVDLLVEFDPSAQVGFLTLTKMQRELSALIRRRVDLVPKRGLKEKIRQAVLDSAEVIYAA